MKNTLYMIYDKVAEANTDVRVGINKATICRTLKNQLMEDVMNGKMDPKDFQLKWLAEVDTDSELIQVYKENRVTELKSIFDKQVDIHE